ncbi:MAG: Ig-like domain-containing protein, partial [Immundisolibacterales bacterium]|nr:Ig-like domain-containing protein [Immundisolibacterales bacterium]
MAVSWACVLCTLAAAPLAPVHARELISNLEHSVSTSSRIAGARTRTYSQDFTTGINAATLTSIEISIDEANAIPFQPYIPVTPEVTLRREGSVVAEMTGEVPLAYADGPIREYFAPAGTTLAAFTTYTVFVSISYNRQFAVQMRHTTPAGNNAEDCGGVSDWSIGDSSILAGEPAEVEMLIAVNGTLIGTAPAATERCRPRRMAATPGDEQVALSWLEPLGSAFTKLQYRYARGEAVPDSTVWRDVPDGDDAGTSVTDELGVVVTGLTNGTKYAFEARAVYGQDVGPKAGPVTATPFNTAPTSADNTVTTNEDTAYAFAATDFAFTDLDTGDALQSVKVATLPGAGALTLSGAAVTAGQSVPAGDLGNLIFAPAANANGAGYASFTFRVNDGDAESDDAYTMTIDVTAVNDAPTSADNTVTTNEDTAYAFAATDFAFTDLDTGDVLASVTVATLPGAGALTLSGAAVTTGQSVPADDLGTLVFTPAANANGASYASFTFRVSDGDAETGEAYTMTIDVTAVNDAPTSADSTVTTNEDTAYTFSSSDFAFDDVDTGDVLASVTVATLPGAGSLALGDASVTAGQSVPADDLGTLVFTPAANANGASYASFTFRVGDGEAESGEAYTMTIDVTAVNDAPTSADNTVTTNEDTAYTFSSSDFAFTDV